MASNRKYIGVYCLVISLTTLSSAKVFASAANRCETAFEGDSKNATFSKELSLKGQNYLRLLNALAEKREITLDELNLIGTAVTPINPLRGKTNSVALTNYSRALETTLPETQEWAEIKRQLINLIQSKRTETQRENEDKVVTSNIFDPREFSNISTTGRRIQRARSFNGSKKLLFYSDDTGLRLTDISKPGAPVEWTIPREYKGLIPEVGTGLPILIQHPQKTLLVFSTGYLKPMVIIKWDSPTEVTTETVSREFGKIMKPSDQFHKFIDYLWSFNHNLEHLDVSVVQASNRTIAVFHSVNEVARVDWTDFDNPTWQTSLKIERPKEFKTTSFQDKLLILYRSLYSKNTELIDWTDSTAPQTRNLPDVLNSAEAFSEFLEVDGRLFIAAGSKKKDLYLFNLTDPEKPLFEMATIEPFIFESPFIANIGGEVMIFARSAETALVHARIDQFGKLITTTHPIPMDGSGRQLAAFSDPTTGRVYQSRPFSPNAETWQIYGPLPKK